MWLLPVFGAVSRACTRIFYRVRVSGAANIPRTGPVILVANHPNSLIDPMLVVASAGRPVRFLAKAPLFSHPTVGWAIRGSGSIPVHRQMDDPSKTGDNVHMFRAVHEALGRGAAIGLFPEGISHSEPSLTPLKTGAARMALGTAAASGKAFPIIPVGMVLADKAVFRSEARVIVGDTVEWGDLADRGDEDREAVRVLTDRIEEGLRTVTMNLADWSDQVLVACANEVWVAERGASPEPMPTMNRSRVITKTLAAHRREPSEDGDALIRDLTNHYQALENVGLKPADLNVGISGLATAAWLARRILLLPVTLISVVGKVVFALPYHMTAVLTRFTKPDVDQVSTHKLLHGLMANLVWLAIILISVSFLFGWIAGLVATVLAPVLALITLWSTETSEASAHAMRRYFAFRRNTPFIKAMQQQQAELADRLEATLNRQDA